jgi:hypothetical protein
VELLFVENYIFVDDIGVSRSIPEANLYHGLYSQDFKIYGMSWTVILRLRTEYLKLGGKEPITEESIQEIFSKKATSDKQTWSDVLDKAVEQGAIEQHYIKPTSVVEL